jgi:poly-gamma-glutamate capsule biosynthesis protein CapA/YwtB (metallophosphatase superfamily)
VATIFTRQITITGVGDIMLDRLLQAPRVFYHLPDLSACPGPSVSRVALPFINSDASRRWLNALGRSTADVVSSAHASACMPVDAGESVSDPDFPFAAIAGRLAESDMVVGNLESPLTTRRRRYANDTCYSARPEYATALKRAGIHIVSFANNHCFDYGEGGFEDTLLTLRSSGVGVIGAGSNLEAARVPFVLSSDGYAIAFIAYSMVGAPHIFATEDESGIVPFNPLVVAEDVSRARAEAEFIVVSVHWGLENEASPSHRIVELAHDCIDVGADVVFGHHQHTPGGIEIYKDRPIFYSLGNFVFGHGHPEWTNNITGSVTLRGDAVVSVRVTPLVGHFQPAVATGGSARRCLQRVAEISRRFGTSMSIDGDSAVIHIH